MPEQKAATKASEPEVVLDPGFYVNHEGNNSGPYPTAEDAEAFNNGHLDGAGKVHEVTAEVND